MGQGQSLEKHPGKRRKVGAALQRRDQSVPWLSRARAPPTRALLLRTPTLAPPSAPLHSQGPSTQSSTGESSSAPARCSKGIAERALQTPGLSPTLSVLPSLQLEEGATVWARIGSRVWPRATPLLPSTRPSEACCRRREASPELPGPGERREVAGRRQSRARKREGGGGERKDREPEEEESR